MKWFASSLLVGLLVGTGITVGLQSTFPGAFEFQPQQSRSDSPVAVPRLPTDSQTEAMVRVVCTDYAELPEFIKPAEVWGTDPLTGANLMAYESDGMGCEKTYIYERPLVVDRSALQMDGEDDLDDSSWRTVSIWSKAAVSQVEGHPLPLALEVLTSGGWRDVRVIEGFGQPITMELVMGRVNLVVVDDIVREVFTG